jgi:hypothetical protein
MAISGLFLIVVNVIPAKISLCYNHSVLYGCKMWSLSLSLREEAVSEMGGEY